MTATVELVSSRLEFETPSETPGAPPERLEPPLVRVHLRVKDPTLDPSEVDLRIQARQRTPPPTTPEQAVNWLHGVLRTLSARP